VVVELAISPGWVFLLGGFVGAITVLISRTFSWKNFDFLTSDEDRQREQPMTAAKRAILLAACVGLAVWGAAWVQHDHNWNAMSVNLGSHSTR
jgi:hypothetical protein